MSTTIEAIKQKKRIGARNRSDIPSTVLKALEHGKLETANLVELLAMDFSKLMQKHFPKIPKSKAKILSPVEKIGITKQMNIAGQLLLEHYGFSIFEVIKTHESDVIRGWACFMVGGLPQSVLAERLNFIQPLANDAHSGVREWAWMALRPEVSNNVDEAIKQLTPWVYQESNYLRRFATEITRPRGVWCAHIQPLKDRPELGLPLLEPLMADPTKYVQDSVSNWLNDAAKSNPAWVKAQCALWQKKSKVPATLRICKRALRSLSF